MVSVLRRSVAVTKAAFAFSMLMASTSTAQTVQHFRTGAIPTDPQTFSSFPSTPSFRAFLPQAVDLSNRIPRPGDQGDASTCVGWAVGYAARSYYAASIEGRSLKNSKNIPSPSYIYNSITDSPNDCNAGSSIIDALNLLKSGSLSLKDHPYNPNVCSRPNNNSKTQVNDFRIENWRAVEYRNIDQIKGEVAESNPVIVSIKSTNKLENIKGKEIYSNSGGNQTGSHAVTIVGYDETRQAFKFVNSWGRGWGDKGFGWISYEAFKTEAQEAYVIQPLKPPEQPVAIVAPPLIPIPQPAPAPPLGPDIAVKPDVNDNEPVTITDVGCGRVSVIRRGGHLVFTGFVGSDEDQQKLSNQAAAAGAELETVVRPWPQCEVLLTLDKSLDEPDHPDVKIDSSELNYQDGSYLRFTITTPSYPSFLYVSYIQADGSVVTLAQPENSSLKSYPGNTKIMLGDPQDNGPKFKIGSPFGREMLVVIASRAPLFARSMPVTTTEREFLTEIRRALFTKPDFSSSDRMVSAGFDTITTVGSSVSPIKGTMK